MSRGQLSLGVGAIDALFQIYPRTVFLSNITAVQKLKKIIICHPLLVNLAWSFSSTISAVTSEE